MPTKYVLEYLPGGLVAENNHKRSHRVYSSYKID